MHMKNTYEKMLEKASRNVWVCHLGQQRENIICSQRLFGIKPFYYAEINGNLVFASEIKAILEYPSTNVS